MKLVISTPKSRGTLVRTWDRILTSSESLHLLEGKDAKKSNNAEEEEYQKLEIEENKEKTLEDKKLKAGSRTMKAVEKVAKLSRQGDEKEMSRRHQWKQIV